MDYENHPPKRTIKAVCILGLATTVLTGCGATRTVENREEVGKGLSYQAQYRSNVSTRTAALARNSPQLNASKCTDDQGAVSAAGAQHVILPDTELLSPGDMVFVTVAEDDAFNGSYEISQDGTLKLPHLPPLNATGRGVRSVEAELRRSLVGNGLYNSSPRVSVRVTDFDAARVHVSGAVFLPGSVMIGGTKGSQADTRRQDARGGTADGRRLSRALQSSGGIRPDADLSMVKVKRGGKTYTLDIRPAVTGHPYSDIILLSGDRVEVPSRGCFQEALVKPTPVTTPGVKVFMSNLSKPADANALSAVGKEARELRYGTRFIQAVVGMNCFGGTKLTNANRSAVLFSRNPLTGQSVVIERKIEALLRDRDRDDLDPFIMPGDALACYDSGYTTIVDIAKGFSTVATAAALSAL